MRELDRLRKLTDARAEAERTWREEIVRRAQVYSVRAVADAAGVSHTQVWRILKASR